MSVLPTRSRQPLREAWTRERLEHERAIAIGVSIELSTTLSYTSATNAYLEFCRLHDMPITPTTDSFSFFAVFMSHHLKPKTVDAYLSGVCNQLEPVFPNVRDIRKSRIVARTLAGCKKLYSSEEHRKRALTRSELRALHPAYSSSTFHDDMLFWAILLTGFHALMRLGELVSPDREALRDYRKIVRRSSVHVSASSFDFYLPGHKADRLFEGNPTAMAEAGVPLHLIQNTGRWASSAFERYIRKHPVLLAAMLLQRRT
ncbi:hypothetical protein GGF50DRAFT_48123 [Schizophyllum commune]